MAGFGRFLDVVYGEGALFAGLHNRDGEEGLQPTRARLLNTVSQ